jgi:hypothetical protein
MSEILELSEEANKYAPNLFSHSKKLIDLPNILETIGDALQLFFTIHNPRSAFHNRGLAK